MGCAQVELPAGIRAGGAWHRDAVLRPLSGHEEVFLADEGRHLPAARRSTELLARCVLRLGSVEPVTAETVRGLSVGDREALLLHLRRLTLGEQMPCVLSCPASGCGKKMNLDLQVSELLVPPYADPQETYEAVVGTCRVRFRLPNGADQEAAAPLAGAPLAGAPERAAEFVLRRCVQEVVDERSGEKLADLLPEVMETLPDRMAELDPQADVVLDLACPECGGSFLLPLDVAEYFYGELSLRSRELYGEVHLLAFHYHWSEAEILGLPRTKRSLYANLLSDALGRS